MTTKVRIMARAMWSGAIGFGMVNIPVKLYTATDNKNTSFHLLHDKCKHRIKEVRWCPSCDRQIDWGEVERGYEYAKGRYVPLSDEDFEQLPLPSKNIVQVTAFVKLEEMDPIYFEKSYYLEPEKTGAHPYNLFVHALREKNMIGLGTVAIRTKERLCALRPVGDTLLLSTLLYPDEIKIDIDASPREAKISKQEMTMASNLIDMLAEEFEPEKYKDNYREALNKVIESKLEGAEIVEEEPRRAGRGEVLNLMDALNASLNNLKEGKKANAKPTKEEESEETAEEHDENETPKKARRKAASKSARKTGERSKASTETKRTTRKRATASKTTHKKTGTKKRGAA
ncbi:MAG: Ku protein [Candidatus Obscuribacterales bacterium]|nr:Ku protein [Candidatus Obscuribacterales bacterium]